MKSKATIILEQKEGSDEIYMKVSFAPPLDKKTNSNPMTHFLVGGACDFIIDEAELITGKNCVTWEVVE